ncbi:unnamed protein product [Cuscuta europaea]|uniref:Uncharacterized protein n=1 Tax=Cuscuta europaea TaxID=41803 RepID=A0A9P0Z5L7_CUSEU|nr:unnamed protein product [Cuscuta europaea]
MNFLSRILSRSRLLYSQPRKGIIFTQTLASLQPESCCSSSVLRERSFSTTSYVLNSPKLAKESGAASSWRRPSEIPFQGKAANSVKLVGCVRRPVQFQTLTDGKSVAATIIEQDNRELRTALSFSMPYVPNFLIPVVFEGDLAHVVKCHVKESDCVFVSGKLCGDPLPFVVGDYEGSFHIVAQDVYFVQGVEEKAVAKETEEINSGSKTVHVVEEGKAVGKKNGAASKTSLEGFKVKEVKNGATCSDSKTLPQGFKVDEIDNEAKISYSKTAPGGLEVKEIENGAAYDVSEGTVLSLENGDQNGVSRERKTSVTKVGATGSEDWWDVINNPNEWQDYRQRKSEGTVKPKYPDFKHKTKGIALWVNQATPAVLKELDRVGFSSEQVKKGKEELWKSLVENPGKWWDNRSNKRNEKGPDFKNKDSGEALWIRDAPGWAISKLPPLPDIQNTASASTK